MSVLLVTGHPDAARVSAMQRCPLGVKTGSRGLAAGCLLCPVSGHRV